MQRRHILLGSLAGYLILCLGAATGVTLPGSHTVKGLNASFAISRRDTTIVVASLWFQCWPACGFAIFHFYGQHIAIVSNQACSLAGLKGAVLGWNLVQSPTQQKDTEDGS